MNTVENASLLIVDDDTGIRESLKKFFGQYGFKVFTANGGETLFSVLEREIIDLIILDVMMPGTDGLELCRQVRTKMSVPIIMLTAMNESTECIVGLEVGADDYLTKPFNPRELLARVKAILRRANRDEKPQSKNLDRHYHFAGWTLNKATRYLTSPDGVRVDLTSGEYNLLMTFITSAQRVLSRDQLMDATKGYNAEAFDRSIDIQVSRLRYKIESDPKNPEIIITVRNGGYMFTAAVVLK